MDVLCEPLDFPSKTLGAVMFVEFVSDNSINDEGFTLVYSASQNRGTKDEYICFISVRILDFFVIVRCEIPRQASRIKLNYQI